MMIENTLMMATRVCISYFVWRLASYKIGTYINKLVQIKESLPFSINNCI